MKMEAEIGMLHLQAKERQRLPAISTSQEEGMDQILPHSPQKEATLSTS